MSYQLKMEIIGGKEMAEAFRKSPEVVNKELGEVVGRAAVQVQSRAEKYAPRRFGGLRGSIHTQGPSVMGDTIRAVVGTNLKYAPYQEFGTGIYAGRGMIKPKRARVLAWKKGGKWIFARAVRGIKGKFYFKKAREETLPLLEDFLKRAVKNIVSHLTK